MLIDWFTVGAQLVNFIVLVLLMRRFLYRPILESMAAREQQIASALETAARKEAESEVRLAALREREDALEGQRTILFKQASVEADVKRKELIAAAREEVATLQARWHEAVAREREQLRHDLTRRVQAEVLAIARKVCTDLASASLEEAMAWQFVRQLERLPGEERAALTAALVKGDGLAIVRSAFPMPDALRIQVERAVRDQLRVSVPVRFEASPEVLCGVELVVGGHKVCWSIEAHLAALEQSLDTFFDQAAKAHAND